MSKYTTQDFRNSKFAEHPDGRRAFRTHNPIAPWIMEMRNGPGHCAKDSEMARYGWVPVPTKPTITESRVNKDLDYETEDFKAGFHYALAILEAEIIPDPEPTNAEKLDALYGQWLESDAPARRVPFHQFMDEAGVKAPGGNDE